MSYNVIKDPPITPSTDRDDWAQNYKDAQVEMSHDQSMFTMASPDDSLLVVGPSRLSGKDVSKFHLVGMVNSFNYNDSSQVQPFKAIGSRRHVFAKTNAPVSGSIARMVILGPNLFRALYWLLESGDVGSTAIKNQKFSLDSTFPTNSNWYTNLEEDLFRFPIGLGIIYRAPGLGMNGSKQDVVVGADYIESCVLMGRNVGMQSGASMIMEQVSFVADRIVPWSSYTTGKIGN